MCGINLVFSTKDKDLKPVLGRMMEITAFRGPDASGKTYHAWTTGQLALGANRLRITDVAEESDQPLHSTCGNYLLAFNGEIYNYEDLKTALLRKGQQFRTASDSEVVLYWLMEEGVAGLSALKGMFALAFVDLQKEKVILARDRHGIKPLYYHASETSLLASSSLKAIMETGYVSKSLNQTALNEYLDFRHVLGSHTFFESVEALAPGTCLVYEAGRFSSQKIPEPSFHDQLPLKEVLLDALTLTSQSKDHVGLLLSGGVDSTLLLALYRNELGYHRMPTYALNTGEDAKWSARAAAQFDADHHLIDLSLEDLDRSISLLRRFDQPIADHGALATWLITEKTAENHRVILTGAGADELFAGYNRHLAFHRYLEAPNAWLTYKKIASAFGFFGHSPRLKAFLKAINNDLSITFQNFLGIHGMDYKVQVASTNDQSVVPVNNLKEALEFDQRNYLVNDVLAITDLATMSHAVEARVPYLYDDVVTAAGAISVEEKIRNGGKAPLKDLLKQYGGKSYTQRRKMGFGLPMAAFMRHEKFPLWSYLSDNAPVFEFIQKESVEQMKAEHLAARSDWNMQLWSILVLSIWLEDNFN